MNKFFQRTKYQWLFIIISSISIYCAGHYVLAPNSRLNSATVSCELVHVYPPVNEQSGKSTFKLKQAADYRCGDTIVQHWVDPYRPPTELHGMYLIEQGDIKEINSDSTFFAGLFVCIAVMANMFTLGYIAFGSDDDDCSWW